MAVPSPQVPGAPSLAARGRARAEPPTQRSIEVVRGAVPKQQPRERERGSSYSARRDNVDNAMPTVRTMTCTHITWVVMVHMKDGQSHAHRLHGLRVVRTDTCPGRVECARRRTKCELCAKCAGQGDRRMLCVTGLLEQPQAAGLRPQRPVKERLLALSARLSRITQGRYGDEQLRISGNPHASRRHSQYQWSSYRHAQLDVDVSRLECMYPLLRRSEV